MIIETVDSYFSLYLFIDSLKYCFSALNIAELCIFLIVSSLSNFYHPH